MKKIISILLAAVMAFSTMPLMAMADDVFVNSNAVFNDNFVIEDEADYSAYDSIIKLVEALDEKEYTKESIDYVKSKIVDRDTLETQEQIDEAVIEIAIAYSELEKNSFTVEFIVVNSKDEQVSQRHTYYYGDTVDFNVDNGENVSKWIISDINKDTKLDSSENDISLVVDKAMMVVAYTDTKPEEKHKLQQIKFLSYNGKTLDIIYTEDTENIEMPEAPALPFYYFSEWIELNDNTYQARYLSDTVCDGVHHRFTTIVIKPSCETVGYVIFQCPCGETYSTDYKSPTGHNYIDSDKYCANNCGKINPKYDIEDGEYVPSENPSTPSGPSTPEKNENYDFDNDGYNNVVITP